MSCWRRKRGTNPFQTNWTRPLPNWLATEPASPLPPSFSPLSTSTTTSTTTMLSTTTRASSSFQSRDAAFVFFHHIDFYNRLGPVFLHFVIVLSIKFTILILCLCKNQGNMNFVTINTTAIQLYYCYNYTTVILLLKKKKKKVSLYQNLSYYHIVLSVYNNNNILFYLFTFQNKDQYKN